MPSRILKLKIAGLVNDSITDGPGLRFAVFAQGCPHNCTGCHNIHTHPFDIFAQGHDMTVPEIIEKIKGNRLLDGITLSGGEPFSQSAGFAELVRAVRKEFPKFNVWCYSGYTYEQIIESPNFVKLLKQLDILIDGRFIEKYHSYGLRFRGSSNQRIINVKKSTDSGKAVIAEQFM